MTTPIMIRPKVFIWSAVVIGALATVIVIVAFIFDNNKADDAHRLIILVGGGLAPLLGVVGLYIQQNVKLGAIQDQQTSMQGQQDTMQTTLDTVHKNVNGRFSEALAKIPDPAVAESLRHSATE